MNDWNIYDVIRCDEAQSTLRSRIIISNNSVIVTFFQQTNVTLFNIHLSTPVSQIWKEHFLLLIIIQYLPSSQIHDQWCSILSDPIK